jgi:hypothetical protein
MSRNAMLPSQCLLCSLLCVTLHFTAANAEEHPDIGNDLQTGNLGTAQESLMNFLSQHPGHDPPRLQLGTVQFCAAVEKLAQDSYRYGLDPDMRLIPFLRTPVEAKPNLASPGYEDVRATIERFVRSVEQVEKSLSAVNDPQLFWKLDLTAVRLDHNGTSKHSVCPSAEP